MQSSTHKATVEVTLYRDGRDDLIGAVYAITAHGGRAYYLAEAHDWGGDDPTGAYVGIHAGTFADAESAARVIEMRARAAYAPDSPNTTL